MPDNDPSTDGTCRHNRVYCSNQTRNSIPANNLSERVGHRYSRNQGHEGRDSDVVSILPQMQSKQQASEKTHRQATQGRAA